MPPSRIFQFRNYWLGTRENSPYWYIFWRQSGTRRVHRRSTVTTDLNAAKEALIALAGGKAGPRVTEPVWLPIDIALHEYNQSITDKASRRTALNATLHLMDFVTQFRVPFASQFTLDQQARYIRWRRKMLHAEGFVGSNGTINRELGVIRAAFNYAHKCGRLLDVPVIELLPEPPPRGRFLTASECRRLLSACEAPHIRLFVMMALHTLQRKSAILRLKVDQVDLVNGRIDFHPPGKPITRKRRPIIPITPSLWPEVARAVQASTTGYVIEFHDKPVKSIKSGFASAARRAGLKDVTPNTLRHTGATLLAAAGVPMRQIAGMLGHSHTRTTERYAHHRPEYLEEAAGTLDALLS